jgi:hypothetical protein
LRVDLRRGLVLDKASGVPSWEAERAVEGLLAGEPHYIELAVRLLVEAKGCILDLPGEVSAVLVRESDFAKCITIGDPVLLFGGEEPGLSLTPQMS